MKMRRREFIALLGSAAAWPMAASAQQDGRVRRVGVLMQGKPTDATYQSYLGAFIEALQKLGWIDGRNLRIDSRWGGDEAELTSFYAKELVGLAPDVIMASTTANLAALQRETRAIPIVFTSVSDPIAQGFVASLARPGGNITGFTAYEFSIGAKWLDLLKQMVPGLKRAVVMFNPEVSTQSPFFLRSIEAAAPAFGVQVVIAHVREPAQIQSAIEAIAREPNGRLIIPTDSFLRVRRDLIADFAARERVPAIAAGDDFVRSGLLMSYAFAQVEPFRGATSYVDRILKGAKPADLPIQQPTRYEFVVSRKTARAFGIEVPLGVLLAADEVIE
jgi:putative tryptophan/tyrosine transport system substrate-binding protein